LRAFGTRKAISNAVANYGGMRVSYGWAPKIDSAYEDEMVVLRHEEYNRGGLVEVRVRTEHRFPAPLDP